MKSPKSISVGQVTHLSQRNPYDAGSVDRAVLDETASLLKSSERPAMVACARAMARILDNDALVAMHPQAARQLQVILNELRSGAKRKSQGRLVAVQQLSKVKSSVYPQMSDGFRTYCGRAASQPPAPAVDGEGVVADHSSYSSASTTTSGFVPSLCDR
jgi:hypothetical protein